jgi:hypothetical protein
MSKLLDISATPLENGTDLGKVESFFAGILSHLPSIAAFAMPLDISYKRVGTGLCVLGLGKSRDALASHHPDKIRVQAYVWHCQPVYHHLRNSSGRH